MDILIESALFVLRRVEYQNVATTNFPLLSAAAAAAAWFVSRLVGHSRPASNDAPVTDWGPI